MSLFAESQERDAALDLLEEHRRALVDAARAIAVEIFERRGSVTSSEVIYEMRQRGLDPDSVDKRFMGCVFRRGWERDGFRPLGSHCRPVSVWKLKATRLGGAG